MKGITKTRSRRAAAHRSTGRRSLTSLVRASLVLAVITTFCLATVVVAWASIPETGNQLENAPAVSSADDFLKSKTGAGTNADQMVQVPASTTSSSSSNNGLVVGIVAAVAGACALVSIGLWRQRHPRPRAATVSSNADPTSARERPKAA